MKFGQQKFFIGVVFLALPLMALFSVLEDTYLSESLLKFSLRYVNFRTGVPVSARAWDLHPTTFSASIESVDFVYEGVFFRAEELELQLSPIDLVFGQARFRNVALRGVSLRGKVPAKWLESDPNVPSPPAHEIPSLVVEKLEVVNKLLAERHIAVSELSLENVQAAFTNLKVKDLNLRFINQSRGQARVELDVGPVEVPQKLAPTPSLSVSMSVVREAKDRPVFLIRNLKLHEANQQKSLVVTSGRFPGQLSTRLDVDLNALNTFFASGKWTKDFHQKNLAGTLQGSLGLNFDSDKSWRTSLDDLLIKRFVFEDYRLEAMELSLDYDSSKQVAVRKANLILPPSLSEPTAWKQSLEIKALKIRDDGNIEGEMQARELGLCSIMIATGVNECFAAFQINGPATFSGPVSPLKLLVKTDWTMSEATVFSEPEVPGRKATDPLLRTKAAKLVTTAMVFDKTLSIADASITWGASKMFLKGDIKYIPTRVELDLKGDQVQLSDVLNDFMDSPVAGIASIKSQILYDYAIPTRMDRTRVFGSLEIDKFSYAGQLIGQISAPLLYEKSDLNIGPASLASGGGSAILRCVLQNRPGGKSRLEASANLRRYEIAIGGENDKSIVRGFYSGVVRLDGFLSEMAGQTGIRGRINGSLDSAEVLGIALTKVDGVLSLKGSDLVLEELRGQKNKRMITANGLIASRPNESFVNFEAKDVDVVSLGWDPQIEGLFNAGKVSLAGKWSEKDGYVIKGDLAGLADPTYSYGGGTFVASGDERSLRFNVDLKSGFALAMAGTYRGDELSFHTVNANLKDQGLFLGLSYLNDWHEKVDLQTLGAVTLNYNSSAGSLQVQDLKFRKHDSSGRLSDILQVSGKHDINWDQKTVHTKGFASSGAYPLSVKSNGSELIVDGKWSGDLIDVLIPDFVRLRDGFAEGGVRLGMPFGLDRIRGDFRLQGMSMGVKGLGRYGQNTTGQVEVRNSRILFQKLRSQFGAGHVEMGGEYKLDWNKPGVYLNVALNNSEFVFIDQVPAVTSGAVVISGNSYPFDVRGRVAITDGLYTAESTASAVTPLSGTPSSAMLKFDIAIDLGAKFAVRNSLISTNAVGSLKLIGTEENPTFVGLVQLENGRVFARDNEFRVVRGVVDFPVASDQVFINITATTDIKTTSETYTITLNATGTTDEPNIEFQSNPPLSLPDIASLLAFGMTRSDESVEASTSLADTARAEALQTIFGKTIGSSLRKRTGLDVRVSARPALAEEQTIPKVTVVRKLSKKVTATFGRSLDFSRPENNVQIDYELLKNVNVSGVWENPNPKETSVGVDLRFKWDVK